MSSISMMDYVILAMRPDNSVVCVRQSVPTERQGLYRWEIEESLQERLKNEHPTAKPIEGGTGWSEPYDYKLGVKRDD